MQINKIQIACIAGGITLFIMGYFFKSELSAMTVSFLAATGFLSAAYFLRTKNTPVINEPLEEDTVLFPETRAPQPEAQQIQQPPPANPSTMQEQIGQLLNGFFSTAHVEGDITLSLKMPTQIEYKGQPVAVDSDIKVVIKGSREQQAPPPTVEQKPQTPKIEYKPVED